MRNISSNVKYMSTAKNHIRKKRIGGSYMKTNTKDPQDSNFILSKLSVDQAEE